MINKFKERRVEEIATPTIVVEGRYAAEDERATEHNYSNPPELYEVLVPIEPQPVFDTDNEIWNWENDELKLNFFPSDTLTLAKHSPLKPGDVIKGHKVLAVLGVEEVAIPDTQPNQEFVMVDDVWHFKYLTTKGE